MYTNRHKNSINHKGQDISIILSRQLIHIESVVDTEEEMTILLRELLCVLNISNISNPTCTAFSKWIGNKPGNGIIIKSLLKSLGQAVKDNERLAELLEVTINSYFVNTGNGFKYLLLSGSIKETEQFLK